MPLKDINTPQVDNGPLAEKRAWLRETVDRLKREQGLSQKDIAARVGDTQPEMSGRLKPGGRAIPDVWLDRFQREFKVTFEAGSAPRATVQPDAFTEERARFMRMIEGQQEEIRELRAELREARISAKAITDLVAQLQQAGVIPTEKA